MLSLRRGEEGRLEGRLASLPAVGAGRQGAWACRRVRERVRPRVGGAFDGRGREAARSGSSTGGFGAIFRSEFPILFFGFASVCTRPNTQTTELF